MTSAAAPPRPLGAAADERRLPAWADALTSLLRAQDGAVLVTSGWDLARERDAWQASAAAGRTHLSVRLVGDEVLVGPRWVPDAHAACPGCVETRERVTRDHPLAEHPAAARSAPRALDPLLAELVGSAAAGLVARPLRPGEMLAVSARGVTRHRVVRSATCPVCAGPAPSAGDPPARWVPASRPAPVDAPTRGRPASAALGGADGLRRHLVDARFGPVAGVLRESRAPFAMSMAVVPGSPGAGYGRACTFGESETVALLEGLERLAGFPSDVPVLTGRSYDELRGAALDPDTLGTYTERQLDSPRCRVARSDAATPRDWVWGHDLVTGGPVLVPAEVGFYQYDLHFRGARQSARHAAPHARRFLQHESSSGCALGSSREEAVLHSLFELAERDAFLLSWHRAVPLPAIDPATVTDPASRRLRDLVDARGFDTHLLVATQDVDLPVVWALAVNRARPYPATFSAAGSGADPEAAVRAALWEVAQLVTDPVPDDRSPWEPMVDDPWLVDTLDDHIRLYTLPETRPRATAVLGGPTVALSEAWPQWPGCLRRAAGGDVRGALEHVHGLFAAAGLARVVAVDQSSREHGDLGLSAVKAVVPGIVPMCFGHAQQRLAGLPRVAAALAGTPADGREPPYDPHPFP